MIIPAFNIDWRPRKIPMTWMLFIINCAVYIFIFFQVKINPIDPKVAGIYSDRVFIKTQTQVYSNYLETHPLGETFSLKWTKKLADNGYSMAQYHLLALSLRDMHFLKNWQNISPIEDKVAWNYWKEKLKTLLEERRQGFGYVWGLNAINESSWVQWFTYQFAHEEFFHLLGNMFFLILFASFVETYMGSLFLLVLYFSSGVLGAWFFQFLEGKTFIPLIGASAAVSGLISFVVFYLWRKRVRFFYFLPLAQKQMGYLYLPAWVIALMWVLSDITGYFSVAFNGVAMVAYGAHLGGLLTGGLFCLAMGSVAKWRFT